MKLISKIIVGTTCLTIFSGTAYVVAISLAPPPNYTVSNAQRIKSYDDLSVNNAYEKRTRSQEFYLGLSRWRRKMIKEEGFLTGRVLEVGAGCGGNVAYYPKSFLTEDEGIRLLLRSNVESGSGRSEADGDTSGASYVLSRIGKSYPCDEIVLCDRSPGMVESCIQKVQSRFGYTPYRYPDYDRESILSMLKKEHDASADDSSPKSTPIRKRKVIQGDGTVRDVFLSPVVESGDEELLMDQGKIVAPILNAGMPGSGLPLLSKDGERELSRREKEMEHRYEFREMLQKLSDRFVQPEDNGATRDKREADGKSKRTAVHDQLVSVAKDSKSFLQAPQPIFSVANYAAEQLPFPDNSFDTVVDMFGLCSYDDPVRALRELSRVCKPGGTLLLIEHGKGDTPRVNNHLDKWAPRHAKNWGCWWNRDIRRVIRLSGLTISKWDNKHFGTSHYIIAKPYKSMQEWEAYNEGH